MEKKIKFKLLKKRDKINNDLACRLIFEVRKQKFAVDFTITRIMGDVTTGSSGTVNTLDTFEDFEKYAKREVG